MRLIDADALMQSLGITDMDCNKCEWHDSEWNDCKRGGDFEDTCCAIEHAPTIEPERKTGKWIKGIDVPGRNPYLHLSDALYCSVCHNEAYWDTDYGQQIFDYCPNCGAKMEGEEDG